ncbi:hypothetical protein CU254_41785 (plasmid) [Amycolatopsis sp. AA4]|uniref:hypothetical protein n=1 Tax=Actinomycetes TaxID=1760 RepID=UPI0001B5714C|nr:MULTISPECIES: hypothetical protein [Actinomycetes]ATY17111.1 hypothetical protein CU254_41785 [Amycolatopsis sp. AA4]
MADDEYWSQWSPAAHARHERIMDRMKRATHWPPRYRLADDAPVPKWLREATDGLLCPPEAPTLQFARVWDRVDWPTLVAEHGDDLVVAGTVGAGGPHWAGVLRAWQVLEDAGHAPELDVDLSVDFAGTGLELTHGGISTGSNTLPGDEVLSAMTDALQVDCEMAWPSSGLRTERRRADGMPVPAVPIQARHSDCITTWIWAGLGPNDVPPR